MGKYENCTHVMASGSICGKVALEDSPFCYWHHKLRTGQRHRKQLGGPVHEAGNTGISLPSLDDPNSIQIGIQEVAHAIIDKRIDSKRAGLLLYALQLASANVRKLTIANEDDRVVTVGTEDKLVDDAIDPDDDSDEATEHAPEAQATTEEEPDTEDLVEEDEPLPDKQRLDEPTQHEPQLSLIEACAHAPQQKPRLSDEEVNRLFAALMRRKPPHIAQLLAPALQKKNNQKKR